MKLAGIKDLKLKEVLKEKILQARDALIIELPKTASFGLRQDRRLMRLSCFLFQLYQKKETKMRKQKQVKEDAELEEALKLLEKTFDELNGVESCEELEEFLKKMKD